MTISFQQYSFAIKRQFSVQHTRSIIFRRHILINRKFSKLNFHSFFENLNQIKQNKPFVQVFSLHLLETCLVYRQYDQSKNHPLYITKKLNHISIVFKRIYSFGTSGSAVKHNSIAFRED